MATVRVALIRVLFCIQNLLPLMCSRVCCVVLLCAMLFSVATAQAPGDEDEICASVIFPIVTPVFPANVRILMDSFNYISLLRPSNGPWQQVDNDDITDIRHSGTGVSWFQYSSNDCQQAVGVCGYLVGPQDNWLITQYISRVVNGTRLSQVSMQVEFQFECHGSKCQRSFILNVWETSTIDRTVARNTTNYLEFDRIFLDNTSDLIIQKQTKELIFNSEEDGFYLALRDITSCVVIHRVTVFYNVCPQDILGLVIYPETIAPHINHQGSLIDLTTVCVPGASPENGVAPRLTCAQEGIWNSVPGSGCQCNPGSIEELDELSCIGCMAGHYLSTINKNECRPCPKNSRSEVSGSLECPCLQDYYRAPGEENLPCTQPPGPPTNVRVVSQSSNSIFLEWDPPDFKGGRNDTRYSLWHQEEGQTLRVKMVTVFSTSGDISGLDPNIRYKIYVSAENGVSSLAGSTNIAFGLAIDIDYLVQSSSNTESSAVALVSGVLSIVIGSLATMHWLAQQMMYNFCHNY